MARKKLFLLGSCVGLAAVALFVLREIQEDQERTEGELSSKEFRDAQEEYYRGCEFNDQLAGLEPGCSAGDACRLWTSCTPPDRAGRPKRSFGVTCDPQSPQGYRIVSAACPEGQSCRSHRNSSNELACIDQEWRIRPVTTVSAKPLADKPKPNPEVAAKLAALDVAHGAVLRWSQAHNDKNLDVFREVYAAEVIFYGKKLSRKEVVARKKQALAADPSYTQRVTGMRVEQGSHGFAAFFEKTWGDDQTVRAKLVFEKAKDGYRLVQEGDAITDAALRVPIRDGCAKAAVDAASSHPKILSDRKRVAVEHPHVNSGGIIYKETISSAQAALGYHHKTRFEGRWWIDVKDGSVTLYDSYGMENLQLPPEVLTRVRRACGAAEGD